MDSTREGVSETAGSSEAAWKGRRGTCPAAVGRQQMRKGERGPFVAPDAIRDDCAPEGSLLCTGPCREVPGDGSHLDDLTFMTPAAAELGHREQSHGSSKTCMSSHA